MRARVLFLVGGGVCFPQISGDMKPLKISAGDLVNLGTDSILAVVRMMGVFSALPIQSPCVLLG